MSPMEKFRWLLIAVIFIVAKVHCEIIFKEQRFKHLYNEALPKINNAPYRYKHADFEGFPPITIYSTKGELFQYLSLVRNENQLLFSIANSRNSSLPSYIYHEDFITLPSSDIVSYHAISVNDHGVALVVRCKHTPNDNWTLYYYDAYRRLVYDREELHNSNADSATLEFVDNGEGSVGFMRVYRRLTATNTVIVETFGHRALERYGDQYIMNFDTIQPGATVVYDDLEKTYYTTETKNGVLTISPVDVYGQRMFKIQVDNNFVVNVPRLSRGASANTFCYGDKSNLKRIECHMFKNDEEASCANASITTEKNVEDLFVTNIGNEDALVMWIERSDNAEYELKARLIPEAPLWNGTISVLRSPTKIVHLKYNAGRNKHCLTVRKENSASTTEYCFGF